MKTLSVTTFKVGQQEFKEVELLKACLNQTPEKGFDVSEMASRLAVLKKLDTTEEEIDLEDAEVAKLKDCVNAMRWGLMDQGIVDLVNKVKEL